MKALLELHYLQNFAPSNLNRDDTGSPKDAYFGGTRRARVSSQSFKRAMRMDFRARGTIRSEELAYRSKRLLAELTDRLVRGENALDPTQARWVAEGVLLLNGIAFVEEKNDAGEYIVSDARSEALAFLGEDVLQQVDSLIKLSPEIAASIAETIGEHREKVRKSKTYKGKIGESEAKSKLRKAVVKALGEHAGSVEKALDGSRAVDVALFGRMLADLPDKNADAAAQVAHAISTHAMRGREFDFYTAVDDLKPSDTAGADMLGTVEFGSATYYRYACVDLRQLLSNLGGDLELAVRGLRAFLEASIYAAPSGKQNTFAAHNAPGLMLQVIRENASPRNLANAFERGVRERGEGFLRPSVAALADELTRQNLVFGDAGRSRYVNAVDGQDIDALTGRLDSVQALIDATVQDAGALMQSLGVQG